MNVDGSGIRRITSDQVWNDTEPTYLADGSVVFASDRGAGASQCGTWVQSTAALNLFRVWPDGTNNDAFYKQHWTHGPYSLRDAMPIPGSTKLVAIGTGHHHIPEGVLMRVSPDDGVNNPQGMEVISTGHSGVQGGIHSSIATVTGGGVKDSLTNRGGYYQTPWAIDENRFIVGHAPAAHLSAGYRLVYVDVWGNKELLAFNPYREMVYPMIVKPRQAPPLLPDATKPGMEYALTYVDNVYADLPGVEPGAAKYLRISSRPEWPYFKDDYGALRWIPNFGFQKTFGFWAWSPSRVIGTVPVEPDGSAYFEVPARLPVYFQLLDANKMEIRRMRSHVEFQKGEQRSCVGCHETRTVTVTSMTNFATPQAIQRAPSHPVSPPFGQGNLDYEEMIQPIFDARCISCHGEKDPEGGLELTRREDGFGFMQGYRALFGLAWGDPVPMSKQQASWYADSEPEYDASKAWSTKNLKDLEDWVEGNKRGKALVSVIERHVGAQISQPYQFGSTQSRLATVLLNDPLHQKEAALTPDQWETLVAWIDGGRTLSVGCPLLRHRCRWRSGSRSQLL